MMQVRCQRCGWMFTLGRDSIGIAVAEAEQAHAEYYQAPCPKCRNGVKIQVKELRRRLPTGYVLPTLLPKPEPIHVKKDEEKPAPAPVNVKAEPAAKPKPEPKARVATKPRAATKRTNKA